VGLEEGFLTLALEVHFPAKFCFNPDQIHLDKLTKVFRITRRWQKIAFYRPYSEQRHDRYESEPVRDGLTVFPMASAVKS